MGGGGKISHLIHVALCNAYAIGPPSQNKMLTTPNYIFSLHVAAVLIKP